MLDPDARRLRGGTSIAHLASVLPDGSPQTVPLWVDTRGDQVVLLTGPHSRKARDLRRDPSCDLGPARLRRDSIKRIFDPPPHPRSPTLRAMLTSIVIQPIGLVRSALRDLRQAPRQAAEGAPPATLEIKPEFTPALHRVNSGTELIVVTWLHRADRGVLQTHPMDDERIPLTGVFATRSPDRPNPIGLHRVTVIDVEAGTTVHVDALEAIDGTPILDLKIVMRGAPDA